MGKLYFSLAILTLFLPGCGENERISPEQRQHEIQQSKDAARALSVAGELAKKGNFEGLLKLYEIATNCSTYTVEYCEVAHEEVILYLYEKPEWWIKTFSQVDLEKFKSFIKSIGVSQFPEGVTSDEQFLDSIFNRLEKIKGNKNEMELIDHIFALYNRKRR